MTFCGPVKAWMTFCGCRHAPRHYRPRRHAMTLERGRNSRPRDEDRWTTTLLGPCAHRLERLPPLPFGSTNGPFTFRYTIRALCLYPVPFISSDLGGRFNTDPSCRTLAHSFLGQSFVTHTKRRTSRWPCLVDRKLNKLQLQTNSHLSDNRSLNSSYKLTHAYLTTGI